MKKLLALILALIIALSLVSCGRTKTETPAEERVETVSSVEEAEQSLPEVDSEPPSGKPLNIGFVQVGHESDWRAASTASAQAVFSAENGYNLSFVDCDQDSNVQINAIRAFIQQQVDYIIVDPIRSTGWDTVLTECQEAGIPVIVIDRTIDDSDKFTTWVGSDFKKEGLACGEWLKAYADAKGISEINALVIEGTTNASAQLGRSEGFAEVADKYGWNIVDAQSGDFTEVGGQEVMAAYCKSYEGQFNVVVCQNDDEAFGAMTAMDAAGVSYGVDGDVILLSFDACTAGLEQVKAGKINADFECNPLAAPLVAEVITQLESDQTPEQELFMSGRCFTHDDTVTAFTVNGETQECTVVDDAVIEAQY